MIRTALLHYKTSLAGLAGALGILGNGDMHSPSTWLLAAAALIGGLVAADGSGPA